jgi:hypothetical protein
LDVKDLIVFSGKSGKGFGEVKDRNWWASREKELGKWLSELALTVLGGSVAWFSDI